MWFLGQTLARKQLHSFLGHQVLKMMLVRWIREGGWVRYPSPLPPPPPPHTHTSQSIQRAATEFTTQVFSSTLAVHTKAQEVARLWPILLADLVHQTFQEYSSIDEQMTALLDKL